MEAFELKADWYSKLEQLYAGGPKISPAEIPLRDILQKSRQDLPVRDVVGVFVNTAKTQIVMTAENGTYWHFYVRESGDGAFLSLIPLYPDVPLLYQAGLITAFQLDHWRSWHATREDTLLKQAMAQQVVQLLGSLDLLRPLTGTSLKLENNV